MAFTEPLERRRSQAKESTRPGQAEHWVAILF